MTDKFIHFGIEIPIKDVSFAKFILEKLRCGGHDIAMVDASTGQQTTFSEILQKSQSISVFLKNFGLNKYDCITVCSENSVNFAIAAIAAFFLGITVAPCNHFYTPREIVHTLNISKPKVIFCSSTNLKNILLAHKDMRYVRKIILMDEKVDAPEGVDKWKNFLNYPIPKDFDVIPVDLNHTAAIMCSSGTTGMPKGVMLSHKNFQACAFSLSHPDYVNFNKTKIGIGLLPYYHAYGFVTMLCKIYTHMKEIVFNRFEEELFLSSIEKYKISHMTLVPPLLILLAKSPNVSKYNLASVKEITCGAAPLSKEVRDLAANRLGISLIRQGYGLTETTLAVTYQSGDLIKSGSSGTVQPGNIVKVRDIETDQTLGPHKPGEICIKGIMVMKGYCGDLDSTAATIDSEGWLRSGDIGYYDEDGHFYIIDRLKELIKYKAFQVPPAELEDLLLSHPQINDCAVIGKPDDLVGELPVAFVVKQPKATITEQDVIDFVAKNVSVHKRLHGGVIFTKAIPKSPTGKILRRFLREQFKTKSKL